MPSKTNHHTTVKHPKSKIQNLIRLGIAFVGGMLMGLTPAPVNAWPLAWLALVPLWGLIVESQGDRKQRLLQGLAWGIGYHGLALSWITGVHPMTWLGVPWLASLAIALFCWVFITLWGAALPALWAALFGWLSRAAKLSLWTRVLVGTALWCTLEAIWGWGPLLWSFLSYTQSPHNLAILHLGQLSGPAAVTAAIVAFNGLVAEAWLQTTEPYVVGLPASKTEMPLTLYAQPFFPWKSLGAAVGLLITLHLVGFGLYSRPLAAPPETGLKVGIIQGNIPNEIKLSPKGFRQALEGYTTGYRTLAAQDVDAVLTPEGALPFLWDGLNRTYSSFYQAVLEEKVVAWLGTFGKQGRSITQSLFTITGDGQDFSRYNKVKLVPLGEYIPFEQFLGQLIDRLSPLDAHMIAGKPGQIFETPFGRAIAGICYESAFANHFRAQAAQGGQFILSASNDAHYSAAMTAQHHAQDIMRAIETDRWAARATNTGYSGIVDPHGKTRWLSDLGVYQLHAATIYRRQTQTLYVLWGDWLTPLLFVCGAIATTKNFWRV